MRSAVHLFDELATLGIAGLKSKRRVKDDQRRRKAIEGLLRLSRAARSGSGGRRVRREDAYGE
jgi:hypothetical protein